MTLTEFRDELHKVSFVAEVNQRYYQIKYTQTWRWDKAIKVGIAFLSVVALLCVFLPHEFKWVEWVFAGLAAAAAITLNVIPVGEWMAEYGEMCRAWNEMYIIAEKLRMKTRDMKMDKPVPEHVEDQLSECITRQYELDEEHAGDDALLARCQAEVTQRLYGEGVRTYEQAVEIVRKANSGEVHAQSKT